MTCVCVDVCVHARVWWRAGGGGGACTSEHGPLRPGEWAWKVVVWISSGLQPQALSQHRLPEFGRNLAGPVSVGRINLTRLCVPTGCGRREAWRRS